MGKKLLKTHRVSFEGDDLEFKWYAVVVMFNHERKVAEMLSSRFENLGAGDKFAEVFVPIKEWEEESLGRMKKDGTRSVRKVKKTMNLLESGYIFIKMIMTDDTWNIVRQTSGVAGWLKMDGKPQPVPAEDVINLKMQLGIEDQDSTIKEFSNNIGSLAKITSGPFQGYEGKIVDVQEENVTLISQPNGIKMDVSHSFLEIL